jgi:hypothetical protein
MEEFTNFVKSFLITEGATINEIDLVERNIAILNDRIQRAKRMFIEPCNIYLVEEKTEQIKLKVYGCQNEIYKEHTKPAKGKRIE